MGGDGVPAPTAEGSLANRPFAHLLLYLHQQEMSGTLAVWPDPVPGEAPRGQDRILIHRGIIVGARLIAPASALDRGLLPLFTRREAPYAFYEANLVGTGDGVLVGEIDPITLITASLRGAAREDAIDAVLGRLGDSKLRLTPRIALDRYGFDAKEKAFVELIRAAPDSARGLSASWGDERMARRLLYLLTITKSVEPWTGERKRTSADVAARCLSQGGSRPSGAPNRKTSQPGMEAAPPPAPSPPSTADDDDFFDEVPPERPGESMPPAARTASAPPTAARPAAARPAPARPASTPAAAAAPKPKKDERELPPEPPPDLSPDHATLWQDIARRARTLDTMNYYQMLGVERDAGVQQVRDAYFALAKKWHPDRLPAELSPLRPWVDEIFHYATQARDTLSDEQKRGEYLKSVQAGGGTPEADRKLNAIVTAAMAMQKVEVLVRRREYVESLRILREAIELNPEDSDAHAMEGWVLLLMAGEKDPPWQRVHESLDRALKLNDRNAKAHYFKAMALKRQNKHQMALEHFRKCAQLDPKNIEAVREVRLAEMRGGKPTRRTSKPPPPSDGGGLLGKLFGGKKK